MNDLFSNLDDKDIGDLAFIINSPAYVNFFKPLLLGMERNMMESIIDPSVTRKAGQSDDYLRGGIVTIRAILNGPIFAIEEYANKQKINAEIQNDADFYKERAEAGSIGPLPYQRMTDDNFVEPAPAGGYDPATDY
jgi:hypothetical protein